MKVLSKIRQKIDSSKHQKLLPVGILVLFLLASLFYVVFFFTPTIDMSINDRSVIHVHSRSQAEVEVYRELPYKATFRLTTGEQFAMDMRYLGLSYFSSEELRRLGTISAKTAWDKFAPFFDTSENLPISIYTNRLFWLKPLSQTIKSHPDILKQLPIKNHLVVDTDGKIKVADKVNGYTIKEADFVKAAEEIVKTGKFDDIQVKSTAIEAEDQASLLGQYPNFVEYAEVQLPGTYIEEQNMKNAFYKMQNIYIAAGETKSISDLLGKLNASSGYLAVKDKNHKEVYGVGAEQIIDAIQQLAFSKMSVTSYKGQYFSIGKTSKGLTDLTVKNSTETDMVFSLTLEEDRISIVLASK